MFTLLLTTGIFRGSRFLKATRLIPFAVSAVLGVSVVCTLMDAFLWMHDPPFLSTLNSPSLHVHVSSSFWFFAALRAFLRSERPYATVAAAYSVTFFLGFVAPFQFLEARSVIDTTLLFYAVVSIRMILADAGVLGVDFGQRTYSGQGRSEPT
jgi:hypothetical protein